jgi:monofunctional biosynthetic peptidoglycan transglycosylase
MWKPIKRCIVYGLVILLLTPVVIIISLRWINPTHSAFILRHNLDVYLNSNGDYADHIWVNLENISPHMAVAVIAAEDQRFPTHPGIDLQEIGKALSDKDGEFRGASTITQQTAKNLFLWPGRSYIRKGLEAGLALIMELFLSKQRILELYLNTAQTGKSVFGVAVPSKNVFNKSAARLNRYEAARIAAVLPNPVKFSIENPSAYVLKRQRWIMKQAGQLGGPKLLSKLH